VAWLDRHGSHLTNVGWGLIVGSIVAIVASIWTHAALIPALIALVVGAALVGSLELRDRRARRALPIRAEQTPLMSGDTFHVKATGEHGTAIGQVNIGSQQRTLRGKNLSRLRVAAAQHAGTDIALYSVANDGDSGGLALDIKKVLQEAGWNIHTEMQAHYLNTPEGVQLRFQGETPEPWVLSIGNELLRLGIDAVGIQECNAREILVGRDSRGG
jgi:hypothetical protein